MTLALEPLPAPDSVLRRRDPRWKLAALLLAATAAAVLRTVPAAALALAGALTLAALAHMPARWYFQRLGLLLPLLALFVLWLPFAVADPEPLARVGPLSLSAKGARLALLIFLKALAVVTLFWVLLISAPLPATLHAAHSLRLPGLFVHLSLLTYRYVFVLAAELERVRVALRVRGFRARADLRTYRTVAHVTGMLLVRGHERAERVGQAMRCRGFDGRFRSLAEFRTTPADVAFFTAVALAVAALAAWDVAAARSGC